jgi:iron complex transport system permease protein
VGAAVAVSGVIGFIGLIVPHILRTLSGSDHRSLLPDSALFGATLLVLADLVCRTIIAPAELPIGIVTAIIGTPLFILLLYKQKRMINTQAA